MDPSGHGYYSPNYDDPSYFGFTPPSPPIDDNIPLDENLNLNEGGDPSANNPTPSEIPPTTTPSGDNISLTAESTLGTREKTSKVWQIFIKDENKQIATCKLCKKEFKHKKNGGTGTLDRHLKNAHANHFENLLKQQQINMNRSGSIANFRYDQKKARDEIAKWAVATNQPFGVAENEAFMILMQTAIQPTFQRIPRTTLRNDIFRLYGIAKENLIALFENLPDHKYALTCDSWKACTNEYYLCITCHWIDPSWTLHKRIIGFKLFEFPHTSINISRHIVQTCRDFRILSKIFTISFDNASNNDASIPHLKKAMSPILDGVFFHIRCACHILNLCVREGYSHFSDLINIIRNVILFLKSSPNRQQQFKSLCIEQGMSFKKFRLDVTTRWNSTFEMFQSVLPFQNQLIEFCQINRFEPQLTSVHFDNAYVISSFLCTFKEATELLSGQYYPTTHHILPTLGKVAYTFNQYKDHNDFGAIMYSMMIKFKKYYDDLPILYCLALCLDPRVKTCGFESMIDYIFQTLNDDESESILAAKTSRIKRKTSSTMMEMFSLYEAGDQIQRASGSSSSAAPPRSSTSSSFNPFSIMKRQRTSSSNLNEISLYEMAPTVEDESEFFDILSWWKDNQKTYPVLAKMARDILTPPVSTVASESAFSESGRTLDERRSRLAPDSLECLMCYGDWIKEERRLESILADDEAEFDEDQAWTTTKD